MLTGGVCALSAVQGDACGAEWTEASPEIQAAQTTLPRLRVVSWDAEQRYDQGRECGGYDGKHGRAGAPVVDAPRADCEFAREGAAEARGDRNNRGPR